MMEPDHYIKTIAETITWLARERMKVEKSQNLNSAIHAVNLEIQLELMRSVMVPGKAVK